MCLQNLITSLKLVRCTSFFSMWSPMKSRTIQNKPESVGEKMVILSGNRKHTYIFLPYGFFVWTKQLTHNIMRNEDQPLNFKHMCMVACSDQLCPSRNLGLFWWPPDVLDQSMIFLVVAEGGQLPLCSTWPKASAPPAGHYRTSRSRNPVNGKENMHL